MAGLQWWESTVHGVSHWTPAVDVHLADQTDWKKEEEEVVPGMFDQEYVHH